FGLEQLRYDEAGLVQLGVPVAERGVEVVRLEAALLEAHLRGAERDAVLVPGDLPADRDHDFGVRPGERHDADRRPAQAAREPFDRAAVRAEVEESGGLDDLLLAAREIAQDRLRHRLDRRRAAAQKLAEEAA